jgi:hypothetical protein
MQVLAVTNTINTKIDLIAFQTIEDALSEMKKRYLEKINNMKYDTNNTYLDEDEKYAQVVDGLEQTEFRIGSI